MQGARKRDYGENKNQTEVQNHVLDDNLFQYHQEHVQFLGYSAEQDEVGHPAEEEDHRSCLEVGLPAMGVGVSVVPCEERDAESQQRKDVEAGEQHSHRPRFRASTCQLCNVLLPRGTVVVVEKVDPGVPERQNQTINYASGEENGWPDQPEKQRCRTTSS